MEFTSREPYASTERSGNREMYDGRGRQQQDTGYNNRDSYRHGRNEDSRRDTTANQRRDSNTQQQQPSRDFRDRDERYDNRPANR